MPTGTSDVTARVPTGVEGLDDVLHGGYFVGSTTLVSGISGVGKTVMGLCPGRGSEFVVRLPMGGPPAVTRMVPAAEGSRLSPLRVLVIEDNADMRTLVQTMLTGEGHRVEVADGGASGLDLARSVRPDVVLVDIGLPDLDGYEVGRQIRAILDPSVRLIAVTGYGQAQDRQRSREVGFDAHLVKPVSGQLLREAMAARDAASR
jgi:CheY-like chemotaxis protein